MKRHLFLDFDRTLFDLEAFDNWLGEFVEKHSGLPPKRFSRAAAKLFEPADGDGMRLYRHEEHFKQVTGRSWSYFSGEIEYAVRAGELDFCYPEVHEELQKLAGAHPDVRILTFGKGEYQRFKVHLCRMLRHSHIPVHVVTIHKRLFLAEEFKDTPGILVDDKPSLNLPPHWAHVWITRNEPVSKPEITEKAVARIGDLTQLAAAIDLLNEQVY